LQQLTQWTFINPDRIRERMEEQKDIDQTYWVCWAFFSRFPLHIADRQTQRVEPFGWDSEDRTYIVLDDNRLYRQTQPPPPPPPKAKAAPKKNSKKARAAARASKRRKFSQAPASDNEEDAEHAEDATEQITPEDDGLGGVKWECVAITLDELNNFIASLAKTRDANEKTLREELTEKLLPLLEKQEESRKRKQAQKERELLNLEKLAHAKRSSRIAGKLEHQRQEEEAREAEKKHQAELVMAKKEQEKWRKLEKERESRMQTREQRLKEREARRILHEEELANLSEDNKKLEAGEGRLSERHLKAEIERKRQALEQLQQEDDWVFDCICGAYGQVDDGTLSIACEKCNVWQHTKCVGVSDEDAQRDDFQFICKTCIRRAKEAEEAKNRPSIKIKFNRPSSSAATAPPLLPPVKETVPREPEEAERSHPSSPVKPRLVQSSPSRSPYDSPYSSGHAILPPIPYSNGVNGTTAPATDFDRRPVSQGSTPAAPLWSSHINGSTPARPIFAAQLNGQNPFSSPLPHSPTSLPPPVPQQSYSLLNGHGPAQTAYTNLSSTPAPNGTRYSPYDQLPRRTSVSFPSPLATAPILHATPTSNAVIPAIVPPVVPADTPNGPPSDFPASTTAPQQTAYANNATYHTNALPPTSAGISPIKQSPPPRPSTANGSGSFGSFNGTPNHIPPVAPLSPSPMVVDLSPPVKQSEPERSRASFVGNENGNGNGNGNGNRNGV